MKHLLKNALILLIFILAVYFVSFYILPYIIPFVIAAVLSVFIEPLVRFLQRKAKMPRALAVAFSMVIVLGGVGSLLAFFFTRLVAELISFSTALPRYTKLLVDRAGVLREQAESFYFSLPLNVLDFIANNIGTIEENIGSYLNQLQAFTTNLLNYLIVLISSIPGIFIIVLVSLIATYFMSKDSCVLVKSWRQMVPSPWDEKILRVTKDVFNALIGYAKAQLILISITFVQTLVGLLIIDAPYAMLMAVIIGVLDIIPVLGPGTIFVPWIIWEVLNDNTVFAIKLGILYIVIMGVRQVLEAKIVADRMGLHPLATLASIYIGLQLLGVAGLILGPLFLISIKALAGAGIINWRTD